jgi:hypothetical protein
MTPRRNPARAFNETPFRTCSVAALAHFFQQAEITKKQDLLGHDREIRELMGAHDLDIADVHVVAGIADETGQTYGRVFYTKATSLTFCAYDLDGEADLKTASAFQASGQRGADEQQALSLVAFYEHNTSRKRRDVKFDHRQSPRNN